jgi:phosphate transport system permease protein
MNQQLRWQPTTPSLGQRLWSAIAKSFPAVPISVGVSLVFLLLNSLSAEPGEPFFTHHSIVVTGIFALTSWGLFFLFFLIRSSRTWSAATFTVAGFAATFFGMAILAVFFSQLSIEVALWFRHTPELVAMQNREIEKTLKLLDELKKAQDSLREQLAKTAKERDELLREAKTDEEKKEIRELFEDGMKRQQSDLKKTNDELAIISANSLRESNNAASNFAAFMTNSPSNLPQDAGIGPALWGSIFLGLITIAFAVPVGVGAALYLEEYRQEGWLARLIQLNINNLAGVPSVVYWILGGFVFVYFSSQLQYWDPSIAPRNLLGGGLTLGLLTLPVIIVSSQEAIRAVPNSLRQGAYALGATKWQVMWTIVLPMARPGIMTGTILALSRAIGEAAPLVLFGAQLFVDQTPTLFSRFTALPMQIFQWSGLPTYTAPGAADAVDIWKYNAALASTILLLVILSMNGVAIFLRNRAQRKTRY